LGAVNTRLLDSINWRAIKTLDDARQVIALVLEALEMNKAEGSTDYMLWQFMDKKEFGYCADCEHDGYVSYEEAEEYVRG